MDVRIDVKGIDGVQRMLEAFPGKAHRACAVALNQTGKAIKLAEVGEMRRVFDHPVPYTLNSLQLTTASKDNLVARVWFKEPARMGDHYLVPQVEGGKRKLKGFERGIEMGELVPTKVGAQINQQGNMSVGQIKQIVSALKKGDRYAGVTSNMSARSASRNKNQRDCIIIRRGNRARLIPGIYQRTPKIGAGIDKKTSRRMGITGARAYQYGRSIGKWRSIIMARGLRPVLLIGRTGHQVKPMLDFYGVANRVYASTFANRFWSNLNQYLQS